MRTFLRHLTRAALGALLPALALQAQVERQRVDTSFAFERGGSVQLSLVSGEIRVMTGTTNEIRIFATIERGRLETSLSRSRVTIEARSINNRLGAGRYEITVPPGTRVDAGAVSGDVSIRGTGAEVDAHSVSGSVVVEDANGTIDIGSVSGDVDLIRVGGRVDVSTVSGEIQVDGATGDYEANTVSGTITIRRGKLRSFRTETVSGDVNYDGSIDANGDFHLNTHSGDVMIALPANAGAALELETWSGTITSDFPLTLQPGDNLGRRNRRMTFNIGQGGARLSAQTFSGDIAIRRAPPARTNEE